MITRRRGALASLVASSGLALAQTPPPTNPDEQSVPEPSPAPEPIPEHGQTLPERISPRTPPQPPQPAGEPTYVAHDRTYHTMTYEERRPALSEYGFALSAGGGVSGFTSETARSSTDTGGGWDVRATIGTRLPVGAEISYLGSAQRISALGLDDNAVLLGNGVQANMRLNLMTDTALQPFLFAGAAWRRYDLTNTDTNTSDVSGSDDVIEFPVGAGLAYRYRGFVVDARGEFRASTNEDLMPSFSGSGSLVNDQQASLHRWGVNANVGYEF